jgi:hypothetical protein
MPESARWELLVERDDLDVTEVRRPGTPDLAADQVELAVERFALTMNNVTYARWGEPSFWEVFPTTDPSWGRLPVWGFARVVRSRHPRVSVGDRVFGMMPLSSHHLVRPAPVSSGFVDTTPDRHFPHPWYRTFRPAGGVDDRDDRRTLLRPVHPASFLFADFVARKAGDGGLTLLVTSASSKVAIGIAHYLRGNPNVRTVGLTSAPNRDFVAGLGLYDEVFAYHDLPAITIGGPAACVDITGDTELLTAVHGRFRESLVHIALLGWTHGAQPPSALADPAPEMFLTPGAEAMAIEADGEDAFFARYHAAEDEFIDATESWLTVKNDSGPDAAAAVFRRLVDGTHPVDSCTVLDPG